MQLKDLIRRHLLNQFSECDNQHTCNWLSLLQVDKRKKLEKYTEDDMKTFLTIYPWTLDVVVAPKEVGRWQRVYTAFIKLSETLLVTSGPDMDAGQLLHAQEPWFNRKRTPNSKYTAIKIDSWLYCIVIYVKIKKL